ncbi:hypothetical protein [Streptomyces sp. NPDC059010]
MKGNDDGVGGFGVRFALLGPLRARRAREQLLLGMRDAELDALVADSER